MGAVLILDDSSPALAGLFFWQGGRAMGLPLINKNIQ